MFNTLRSIKLLVHTLMLNKDRKRQKLEQRKSLIFAKHLKV